MTIFYLVYALMALIGYGYTGQVIAFNSPTEVPAVRFLISLWRGFFWFFYLPIELGKALAYFSLSKIIYIRKNK
jgi:hypothetical protein